MGGSGDRKRAVQKLFMRKHCGEPTVKGKLSEMHTVFCLLPAPVECLVLCRLGLVGNQSHAHDHVSFFSNSREGFQQMLGKRHEKLLCLVV